MVLVAWGFWSTLKRAVTSQGYTVAPAEEGPPGTETRSTPSDAGSEPPAWQCWTRSSAPSCLSSAAPCFLQSFTKHLFWHCAIWPSQNPSGQAVHSFSRACHNEWPQTGCLHRNLFSHSSGGQKSEIKMLVELIPSELRENLLHAFLQAPGSCWQFLAFLGWYTYHCNLYLYLHMAFLSGFLSISMSPLGQPPLDLGPT